MKAVLRRTIFRAAGLLLIVALAAVYYANPSDQPTDPVLAAKHASEKARLGSRRALEFSRAVETVVGSTSQVGKAVLAASAPARKKLNDQSVEATANWGEEVHRKMLAGKDHRLAVFTNWSQAWICRNALQMNGIDCAVDWNTPNNGDPVLYRLQIAKTNLPLPTNITTYLKTFTPQSGWRLETNDNLQIRDPNPR